MLVVKTGVARIKSSATITHVLQRCKTKTAFFKGFFLTSVGLVAERFRLRAECGAL